jgi:hypothetical protein
VPPYLLAHGHHRAHRGPRLVAFDWLKDLDIPYGKRLVLLERRVMLLRQHYDERIQLIHSHWVNSMEELLKVDAINLAAGLEGTIIRDASLPGKPGRSSKQVMHLWRIKRFIDFEVRITKVFPAMENRNPAKVNELGRTERSSHKANKVPKDMAGTMQGVVLKDVVHEGKLLFKRGMVIDVGPGKMDHDMRRAVLANPRWSRSRSARSRRSRMACSTSRACRRGKRSATGWICHEATAAAYSLRVGPRYPRAVGTHDRRPPRPPQGQPYPRRAHGCAGLRGGRARAEQPVPPAGRPQALAAWLASGPHESSKGPRSPGLIGDQSFTTKGLNVNTNKYIGLSRAGARKLLLRSDSTGSRATIANGLHHAQATVPLAAVLLEAIEDVPFKAWVQGNNVHTLVAKGKRQYRFRPLRVSGTYIGLELSRVREGEEAEVLLQLTEPSDVPLCISLLHKLAAPQHLNEAGGGIERLARLPAEDPAKV